MGGGPAGQRGGLLVRARLPQAVQQAGHGARVVEGGVGGGSGPAARRPARARPPPAGCPAGWPRARVVEGGVGGRVTGQQRGGLLVRARRPQAVQQAGHAARVVEGGVGGGPARQRGGLLVRARLPQAVQQPGHGGRVVEGGVGGGPAGQRGGLLVRARLPQAVQELVGHAAACRPRPSAAGGPRVGRPAAPAARREIRG